MRDEKLVLVVPAVELGRGGGHIKRSAWLVTALRAAGVSALLFFEASGPRAQSEFLAVAGNDFDHGFLFEGDPVALNWTFIVLDRFRTSSSEFARWSRLAPLVGIDEGGRTRASFDYLLDLLPGLPGRPVANLVDPGLLPQPKRMRSAFVNRAHPGPLRVLVSFGAEDPHKLTLPVVRALSVISGLTVEALVGVFAEKESANSDIACMEACGARVFGPVDDLKEYLADYDLLVTQFGLTAFEAARARVPVLLVSPTRYHERLARTVGFRSAGIGPSAAARIAAFLGSKDDPLGALPAIAARSASVVSWGGDPSQPASAATLLSTFEFPVRAHCPLCGTRSVEGDRPLVRFSDRTYRRCPSCGIVHMVRPASPPIVYARDYFFDDYKKQYGRTYLEDFPNLERSGVVRVERIMKLLPEIAFLDNAAPKPRLLDIGCAYGPFLSAARSAGFDCFGLDPAEDAAHFVQDSLGIPAAVGSFPAFDPVSAFGGELFDVVSLWYVIEHFQNLGEALTAAASAVKPGGVLAFSTPSLSGVSAKARFVDFLSNSPADHWTLWEPSSTARILRLFGFELEKIVITGHHPERFPLLSNAKMGGIVSGFASALSRVAGLGDTFEAYALRM